MSLLFLLFFPVIIGLVGFLVFGNKITWQEFFIQEVAVILVVFSIYAVSSWGRTRDTEVWNGVITSKERDTEQCSESYSCNCHEVCDGDSCHRQCQTCYRHWTITNWSAYTSNQETAYDEGSCYDDAPFEPKRYTEIVVGEPTAIEHAYTNYIKGSSGTILRRTDVTKEFVIPDYPSVYDHYRIRRLLAVGYTGAEFLFKTENEKLDKLNAELGAKKQVNITILVVNESDQLYVEKLRQEWLGGKKNDFIVVIGAPEYPKIAWADVVSWSDSEDAKSFTKNRIVALGTFDLDKVLTIISEEVSEKYTRKSMDDFKYLKATIEPSPIVKAFIMVFSIVLSVGLTAFFHKNDIN